MFDLIDKYVDELTESKEFKRLLQLKKIIDSKYGLLIISLKTKEAKYLEAKQYGDYYPNLKDLQLEFSNAKKELYSKEEVVEYFNLEKSIQAMLDDDFNELKYEISNKLKINNTIKI